MTKLWPFLAMFLCACGTNKPQLIHRTLRAAGSSSNSGNAESAPPPGQETGSYLYGANCVSCHGPLSSSSKRGKSSAQIKAAIGSIGPMAIFKGKFSDAQIDLIASALSPEQANVVEGAAMDGAALYGQNCASCHNELSKSTRLGRSAASIQIAINSQSAMKGLANLSANQINLIAAALAIKNPLTDGATLYANNCASCHGALAHSTRLGYSAASITNAISNSSGRAYGSMKYLSFLTSDDVAKISSALNVATPAKPTTKMPLLMNRTQLSSRLQRVYGKGLPETDQKFMIAVLNTELLVKPDFFGGNCDFLSGLLHEAKLQANGSPVVDLFTYDVIGTKRCTRSPLFLDASSSPGPNTVRAGGLYRICTRFSSHDNMVLKVLAGAGVAASDPVNNTTLQRVMMFMTASDPGAASLTALKVLANDQIGKGHKGLDVWRYVLIPICSSATMETL